MSTYASVIVAELVAELAGARIGSLRVDADTLTRIREGAFVHIDALILVNKAVAFLALALEGSHRVDADPLAGVSASCTLVHIFLIDLFSRMSIFKPPI